MEPLTTLSTALAVAKTLRDLAKSSQPSIEGIRASISELPEALNDLSGAVVDGRRREAGFTCPRCKNGLSASEGASKSLGAEPYAIGF